MPATPVMRSASTQGPPVPSLMGDPRGAGKLVLGDQAHGEEHRVAGDAEALAETGCPSSRGATSHRLHPVPALDPRHHVAEVQRDGEVVEALHDVARAARGVGLDLDHGAAPCSPPG